MLKQLYTIVVGKDNKGSVLSKVDKKSIIGAKHVGGRKSDISRDDKSPNSDLSEFYFANFKPFTFRSINDNPQPAKSIHNFTPTPDWSHR